MRVIVLGAAAGGGFPQWNAGSEACLRARSGDPAARPATQASIAVSSDGLRWLVINATPDLRQQIEAVSALQPRPGLRNSPISAVALTNADVDAVAGLLHLREGTPFALYAPPRVLQALDASPIFEVVNRSVVPRRAFTFDRIENLTDAAGAELGLTVEPFIVPGKVPLYAEGEAGTSLVTDADDGDCVGLTIMTTQHTCHYVANCARIDAALKKRLVGGDLLFMDGTLWTNDEMILQGVGKKTARRMGHVHMAGADGAIEALRNVDVGRRVFIHINNTNPVLLADSDERRQAQNQGWEIARDGMEIGL